LHEGVEHRAAPDGPHETHSVFEAAIRRGPRVGASVERQQWHSDTYLEHNRRRAYAPSGPKYSRQHRFYCGVDFHARSMYVCIIDQAGQ
jgi:hypothetical protein